MLPALLSTLLVLSSAPLTAAGTDAAAAAAAAAQLPWKTQAARSGPASKLQLPLEPHLPGTQARRAPGPAPSLDPTKREPGVYLIGIGKADITGPIVDVNPMGYSMPDQIAAGIHTRLYARTFIFADPANTTQRVVFVNMDAGMGSQLLTMRVLETLKREFGGLYNRHNVALSGQHTHAAPGGYLQYVAYSLSAMGYIGETFNAMHDGIVESIRMAHADLRPSRLSVASGEVLNVTINRSPTAYEANPAEERARYPHDTDKIMTLLRIHEADERSAPAAPASGAAEGAAARRKGAPRGRGLLNWLPVHPTSMNNTNPYISGDNKGAAEQFVEKWAARRPDLGPGFVAAFAQSNHADTTPNILGAYCMDTGLPCNKDHSICGDKMNSLCWGRGPGWPDDFKSTEIIGQRQADKAQELWDAEGSLVTGPVDSRHVWVDMSNVTVAPSKWAPGGKTCKGAMGFSFAAGTTDGPGAYFFMQGDKNGTAFWRMVRNFMHKPSSEQEACHHPKPIVLDAGAMWMPYQWLPSVVDVSLLRIGSFVIAAVPGEFTTMAGRRVVAALQETIGNAWGPGLKVVVAGLTNTYSSYITTPEEYSVQRYEGGFTLFGPNTLGAYIQTFTSLAKGMMAGAPSPEPAVAPPDLTAKQLCLLTPPIVDTVPFVSSFGDVVMDVAGVYRVGERVDVTFRAGNPRHDLHRNGTFLLVQRLDDSTKKWIDVATDNDWSTRLYWERHFQLPTQSFATVKWRVPEGTPPGVYRIKHFGSYRSFWAGVRKYEGTSGSFVVADSEEAYEAYARRFYALSRVLALESLPGSVKGAAAGLELQLSNLLALKPREPMVISHGLGIPQSLAPPRYARWWRGEGGDCQGSAACMQHGPLGFRATFGRSVHKRCPEWWSPEAVSCKMLAPRWGR